MATSPQFFGSQPQTAPGPSPILAWVVMAGFVLVLALLGGSSRPDTVQIVALRPLAALFLIPPLYFLTRDAAKDLRWPLVLFGALAAWMILQLIPLPTTVWQALPDRDIIASLDELSSENGGDVWRPISLVPARGLNALASLIVPAAAFALALALKIRARDLFLVIGAIGAVSVLVSFAQLASGANGPFYLYAITNAGSAVGLFANENHAGVFASIAMLVTARLVLDETWHKELFWLRVAGSAVFLLLFLGVIVNGSRAGFGAGMLALCASVVMLYFAAAALDSTAQRIGQGRAKRRARPQLPGLTAGPGRALRFLVGGFVVVVVVITLFVLNGRVAGLESVLNKDAFDDLRWLLLPTLQEMAVTHWLVGTGFGSFEEVYHIYEPTQLLRPTYVNQAHNDWAQLIIEGGIVAVAIILGLLIWIAKGLARLWSGTKAQKVPFLFWLIVFAILAGSAIFDYPLRTPLFQGVAVWLIIAFALDRRQRPGSVQQSAQ